MSTSDAPEIMSCKLQIERKDSMPSFFVSDTNSLYKTNVSYLDTEDNKWAGNMAFVSNSLYSIKNCLNILAKNEKF